MADNIFQGIYIRATEKANTKNIDNETLFAEFSWLKEYESGSGDFNIFDVEDLANYLHLSFEFLLEGKEDYLTPLIGARHSYTPSNNSYDPASWDEITDILEFPIALYRELGNNIPASSYVEKDVSDIIGDQTTAVPYGKEIREQMLSYAGPEFLLKLPQVIEEMFGIDVFIIRHEKEFAAYSGKFTHYGRAFIVVQESEVWFRTIFGILHELGHILHGQLEYFDNVIANRPDELEKWVNGFASNVIFPAKEELERIDWVDISEKDIFQFLWDKNISPITLCAHLRKMNINGMKDKTKRARLEQYAQTNDPKDAFKLLKECIGSELVNGRKQLFNSQHISQWIIDMHQDMFDSGQSDGFGLARIYDKSVLDMYEVNPQKA